MDKYVAFSSNGIGVLILGLTILGGVLALFVFIWLIQMLFELTVNKWNDIKPRKLTYKQFFHAVKKLSFLTNCDNLDGTPAIKDYFEELHKLIDANEKGTDLPEWL